jgi:hypothetical protein
VDARRVHALVLDDGEEYKALIRGRFPHGAPDGVAIHGFPLDGGARLGALIVARNSAELATFTHELVHAFVAATLPNPPPWFTEGLATYAETVFFGEGKAWFGRPSAAIDHMTARFRVVRAADLWGCNAQGR